MDMGPSSRQGDPKPPVLGRSFFLSQYCFFYFLYWGCLTVMEYFGTKDMVDYSSDSLERVFSTMGELALVGNIFLGME